MATAEHVPDRERKRRYAKSPKGLEQQRKWRQRNPDRKWESEIRSDHGMTGAEWWAIWDGQRGCCYLCGDPFDGRKRVHVDHDHGCCPRRSSCRFCRRGLACGPCNQAIGLLRDDPDRMRRVAANLEAVATDVRRRIAAKPVQMELA